MSEDKKQLSQILDGVAQLILLGLYPASHAKLVVEAITVLETLAKSEADRELLAAVEADEKEEAEDAAE